MLCTDPAERGRRKMQIDVTNAKEMGREVNTHDSVLEEFRFDRKEKRLYMVISDTYPCARIRSITCHQVIGFAMTAGDYWGPSSRINGLALVEGAEKTLTARLLSLWSGDRSIVCPLGDDPERYIEMVIEFISGDLLRVVCERIVIA